MIEAFQARNIGWAQVGGLPPLAKIRAAMTERLETDPKCVWCGDPATTAHHVRPVHVAPELAADKENLVSVCRQCHLQVFHAGDWRKVVEGLAEAMAAGNVRVR